MVRDAVPCEMCGLAFGDVEPQLTVLGARHLCVRCYQRYHGVLRAVARHTLAMGDIPSPEEIEIVIYIEGDRND